MVAKKAQGAGYAAAPGRFLVRASACATCIYRSDNPHDIETLEAEVRDPHGFVTGYRICHYHDDVCCRGFWNRHKGACDATQMAQR